MRTFHCLSNFGLQKQENAAQSWPMGLSGETTGSELLKSDGVKSRLQWLKNKVCLEQGSRQSKSGWELTKSGCDMRPPELFKKHMLLVFKLFILITRVFMHLCWAVWPNWLATSISISSFWLVDTYFWSYFSWLAKSGCQNHKLAGNTFPSFWSPGLECNRFTIYFYYL